jgi:hypothetical protein
MQLVFAHTSVARIEYVTDQRNAAACRLLERLRSDGSEAEALPPGSRGPGPFQAVYSQAAATRCGASSCG